MEKEQPEHSSTWPSAISLENRLPWGRAIPRVDFMCKKAFVLFVLVCRNLRGGFVITAYFRKSELKYNTAHKVLYLVSG